MVSSNDEDTLGTVSGVDEETGAVTLDLDSELESSLEAPVETIVLPPSAFVVTDEGLMINMTQEELAAAVNMEIQTRLQMQNE